MAIASDPHEYASLFHALRTTGTATPVPRGLPPLTYLPANFPNPWMIWFIGGILLGVLLFQG